MTTYEAAVKREMVEMATKTGTMTAELRCARSTLSAIQPFVEPKWVRTEVAELLGRIDLALGRTT